MFILVFFNMYIPFHLQDAVLWFPFGMFALPAHYSCALGTLLNKLRATDHKHCDTATVNLITEQAAK